jgi:S1-C subfamily serine protease
MKMRMLWLCGLVVAVALAAKPVAAQAGGAGGASRLATLSITVAIVGDNLEVKPVPLFELWVTPTQGGDQRVLRTHLDGTATTTVPVGSYRIEGAQPVTVNGKSYEWVIKVEAQPGTSRVELTNENATTRVVERFSPNQGPGAPPPTAPAAVVGVNKSDAPPAGTSALYSGEASGDIPSSRRDSGLGLVTLDPAPPTASIGPQRQMAPEMDIYRQVRTGVFRIESGLAHGSGFLVDTAGFVLTNAHVVSGQSKATAVLDSLSRIDAQIVYRDDERDVAVLRVAPKAIQGRPALRIAVGAPLVDPGERVLAIGYPLNQDQTLTSGIVSGLREGAIITDVNINHGNSGGPLLNLAGEVVGINAFGDFASQGGPGIYGSILITRALEPLSLARTKAATIEPPSPAIQALMSSGHFTTHDLKAFADSVKLSRYAAFDSISVGKFFVTLTTPPIAYVRRKAFEEVVGKDRKRREAKANLDESARYSEMREYRD